MFSLETIEQLSDEATERASHLKKTPLVFWDDDHVDRAIRSLPSIGSYVPDGWTAHKEPLFADSSGFGECGERALSFDQLKAKVKEYNSAINDHHTIGWAIVETGQFQCYIQAFRKGKGVDNE